MTFSVLGPCVFLGLLSVSLGVRRINYDEYKNYEDLCPKARSANVLTTNRCDLRTYVMCYKGRPLYTARCPDYAPRFNVKKGFCDYERNVHSIKDGCDPQQSDIKPTTCEQGAEREPKKESCRSYWVCQGTGKLSMPCNRDAYFIEDSCRFDVLPYRMLINQTELNRCRRLDPWKPEPEEENEGRIMHAGTV